MRLHVIAQKLYPLREVAAYMHDIEAYPIAASHETRITDDSTKDKPITPHRGSVNRQEEVPNLHSKEVTIKF